MPIGFSIVAIVLIGSLMGCASATPTGTTNARPSGRVITAEMIARTHAETAWDVLDQSGLFRMVSESGGSRASIRSRRGKTSMVLAHSDVPRVIIDGARIADVRSLRDVPAHSIAWIQILGGIEGTAEQGTNSGAGLIIVVSKAEI